MKRITVERADLESCVRKAQQERLIITRKGRPMALVVGVAGLDPEQVELGGNDKFWKRINQRRKQKTISRAQLEQSLDEAKGRSASQPRRGDRTDSAR